MNPSTQPANQPSTPSYTLTCRMSQEAAALERLCQVVRIRGFKIARMAVESAGEHLDIALTLEGTRPIAMLQAQLLKLHTVAEVVLDQGALARSLRA
ncbi:MULTISPECIES: ACT domain-containing protein [Marinobacter]|jgi:acetolactate synthase II small subunit|uniref:ACT domain-containing protein n=1 Tax=Marinobacter TaxID=2742 RepID=UPI001107F004|nr:MULTISPECIES: ACT domain-containing protein [Marinobacter]MCK2147463.1 ACT domain-containing protein [Marinobacter alexandrii]